MRPLLLTRSGTPRTIAITKEELT
ncbi:hypothetical protein SAMN05660916_03006 [Arthrobacter sp. 31Cvi3.1E]|nr:hypothetical protein SAMN05660916_03006 [Arthrobacter sp. 31Cvi3.1E]